MDAWDSKCSEVVDCHVHMGTVDQREAILAIGTATGIGRMGLVAIQQPATGSGLGTALLMKARHPSRFYVVAGLNHAQKLTDGRVGTRSLAEQARDLAAMGCEGIKMIEGKPTSRQVMDVPVTDPYFEPFWEEVEARDTPIVWHVNDPEEFWDADKLPGWAKERNWGYGPGDVRKEQLYAEVDEVLTRHPALRITFAHFYFLSADLPRAARFLDQHPTKKTS